jgi:1-deoxy-D-xylulose-5-phosphate synthase
VIFCLDRAGLVGEDGPTHHGCFDLSFLRHIPNMCILAPRHEKELPLMLEAALAQDSPAAIRYPRGHSGLDLTEQEAAPLVWGEGEVLQNGADIAIIGIGTAVNAGLAANKLWRDKGGKSVTVFNARFVKPLPEKQILTLASRHKHLLLLEENALAGGFSSAVLEFLSANGLKNNVSRLGLPDIYIEHGPAQRLREQLGLCAQGVLAALQDLSEKS